LAIATAATRQGEDAVLEVEVINEARLHESFGNLLRLFVLGFKRVYQFQANEVGHFDFNGHGAAVGGARVAHARLEAGPTVEAIDVNDAGG